MIRFRDQALSGWSELSVGGMLYRLESISISLQAETMLHTTQDMIPTHSQAKDRRTLDETYDRKGGA